MYVRPEGSVLVIWAVYCILYNTVYYTVYYTILCNTVYYILRDP